MSVEAKRGCGFRKAGGIYLVSDAGGVPCERMPIPLVACSHCGEGIKTTRGWQWVPVPRLFDGLKTPCSNAKGCKFCPVCTPTLFAKGEPGDRVGLITIGGAFYDSPEVFMEEAKRLGISRRISALPKGFVIGKSWVALAHPKGTGGEKPGLAVIHLFRPARVELIVTPNMRGEDWVERYVAKGVTLVEVPADDPDHVPSPKKVGARRAAVEKAKTVPKREHQFSLFNPWPRVRIPE